LYFVSAAEDGPPLVCKIEVAADEPFKINNLPPGDYHLVAIEDADPEGHFGRVGVPSKWEILKARRSLPIEGIEIQLSESLGLAARRAFRFDRGLADLTGDSLKTADLGPCGRVLLADGAPAAGAMIQVREYAPGAGAIDAPDTLANHEGYFGMLCQRLRAAEGSHRGALANSVQAQGSEG
jgi:hypothetical protein